MSKLSTLKYINRKALSTIYSMLSGSERPPAICEIDGQYWVTNSCVAFAFCKDDFIFNPAIFRAIPELEKLVAVAVERATNAAHVGAYKACGFAKANVKLCTESSTTFVNKDYLDMFTDCCFIIGKPTDPVTVKNSYGDVCGIIMPVRLRNDEVW